MNASNNNLISVQNNIAKLRESAEKILSGKYNCLLWIYLIELNPIGAALKAIDYYKETINEYDTKFEVEVNYIENNLADYLIENKDNHEIKKVIKKINKSKDHGIIHFKNIIATKEYIAFSGENSKISDANFYYFKKEEAKSNLSNLNSNIIINIFFKCTFKEINGLMQTCKFFHEYDKPQFWKDRILKIQNQKFFKLYPELNKEDDFNVKIKWKQISHDLESCLHRITNKKQISIIFGKKEVTSLIAFKDTHFFKLEIIPQKIPQKWIEMTSMSCTESEKNKLIDQWIKEFESSKSKS